MFTQIKDKIDYNIETKMAIPLPNLTGEASSVLSKHLQNPHLIKCEIDLANTHDENDMRKPEERSEQKRSETDTPNGLTKSAAECEDARNREYCMQRSLSSFKHEEGGGKKCEEIATRKPRGTPHEARLRLAREWAPVREARQRQVQGQFVAMGPQEIAEKREARLRQDRERSALRRAQENPDEREARLRRRREYCVQKRALENPDEREARLRRMRECRVQKRVQEGPDEREARLRRCREHSALRRAQENPDEREARLGEMRERAVARQAQQRLHNREGKVRRMRKIAASKRAQETSDDREATLRQRRERIAARRAKEDPVEREARRRLGRECIATRRAQERLDERKAQQVNELDEHEARLDDKRDQASEREDEGSLVEPAATNCPVREEEPVASERREDPDEPKGRLNQARQAEKTVACALCQSSTTLRCSECKSVYYCCKEHQREHWSVHRTACRAYEIVTSSVGQYVIASRDIQAGDIILKEAPLVLAPSCFQGSKKVAPICVGCWRELHAPGGVYCPRCKWPACSPDCPGLSDQSRHQHECIFLSVIRLKDDRWSMQALLPLRCIFMQYKTLKKWKIIRKMVMSTSMLSDEELRKSETIDGVTYIEDSVLKPYRSAEVEYQLEAPLWTALEMFSFIRAKARTLLAVQPLVGIYTVTSLLEHSCLPNTRLIYEEFCDVDANGAKTDTWRGRVTVRATKNITKGDHLTSAFADLLSRTSARQEYLRSRRNILCSCARCTDPSELDLHSGTIKCRLCSGWVLPTNAADITNSEWKCCEKQCGTPLDPRVVAVLLDSFQKETCKVSHFSKFAATDRFLQKAERLLHPHHDVCIKIKRHLSMSYGVEAHGASGLSQKASLDDLKRKSELSQEVVEVLQNPLLCAEEHLIAECYLEKGRADAEIMKRNYFAGRWGRRRVEVAIPECLSLFRSARLAMPDYHPFRNKILEKVSSEYDALLMWTAEKQFKLKAKCYCLTKCDIHRKC